MVLEVTRAAVIVVTASIAVIRLFSVLDCSAANVADGNGRFIGTVRRRGVDIEGMYVFRV